MEKLFTVKDVARILQVSESTVRRWIEEGTMRSICLRDKDNRKTIRIKHSIIKKLLED